MAVPKADRIHILDRSNSDSGATCEELQQVSTEKQAEKKAVQRSNSETAVGSSSSYEVIRGLPEMGYNTFPDDAAFTMLIREGELALDAGIKASLSKRGTSGCYFVLDREQVCSATSLKNRYRVVIIEKCVD
ncbi:hypothetical protein ACOMHN_028766 [Nucella lapillus]